MKRRKYLTTVVLGGPLLTGCADRADRTDSPSVNDDEKTSPTEETLRCTEEVLEAESPFPTVHVHQDNMESGDVSYEVGGCSPFSSSSPAEIEILISNDSSDDKLEFPGDYPLRWESGIPKPHIESPSDSPSHLDVYLKDIASRQNLVPPTPDKGCWRASTSPQIDDTNEEQVILEPGESRTWEFVLLENATTSECLLEEKYMIENQSLPGNFKFELELEY